MSANCTYDKDKLESMARRIIAEQAEKTKIKRQRRIDQALIAGGILCLLAIILISLFWPRKAHAQTPCPAYSNEQIAQAIYRAENSVKFPYGIKSINTHGDKAYAKKICLQTIRNHRKRHLLHHCNLDFITCLGMRYCPPSLANINRNWVANVRYYLGRIK